MTRAASPRRTGRVRLFRPHQEKRADKSRGDIRRDGGELRGQPMPCAAKIGPGKNNARTDDANANLAGAIDRKHEDGAIGATSRSE